jgi:hypothetical protein
MQVLGNRAVVELANSLAARAPRQEIADWILRTVPRHIRKTTDLLTKFAANEQKQLEKAMQEDGLPAEACQRVMVVFKAGEQIYRPNPKALAVFGRLASDVMDWMGSLDDRDRRVRRIDRMSWPDAEALSKAWHVAVVKRSANVKGDPSRGARRIAELDGGTYVAELESKAALVLEGRSMDHCVGGYWARVHSNSLRIISLRDADGMPAVTIELNRPPKVNIVGYGEVELAFTPPIGASQAYLANFSWRAAQVRGRSNQLPSKKWLKRVESYFAKEGIRWDEYAAPDHLRSRNGVDSMTVYGIGRSFFANSEDAIIHGNDFVAKQMAKGLHIRAIYESSGLKSIHEVASPDNSARDAFFDTLLPNSIAQLKACTSKRQSLTKAIQNSGVAYVLSMLGSRIETKRSILSGVCELEDMKFETKVQPVVRIGDDSRLNLVAHRIPLMPLVLLSNGLISGIEDEAVTRLKPSLERVMAEMERRPDAMHAISPIENGSVATSDIFKAFLICGLGDRLTRLMTHVGENVRSARGEIVLDLKRARRESKIEQPEYNRLMNLLADGYEDRIEAMINEQLTDKPMLITGKRLAPINRPAPARPAPLKTFHVPQQARMARR